MKPKFDIFDYIKKVEVLSQKQFTPEDKPPLNVWLARNDDNKYDVCLFYQEESGETSDSLKFHFLIVLTVQDWNIVNYFDKCLEIDDEGIIDIYGPSATDRDILILKGTYGYNEYDDGIYKISGYCDSELDNGKQLVKLPKGGK